MIQSGTLSIYDELTGARWRVWPERDPVPPGAIHESGSYLFELDDADRSAAADLFVDDHKLESLRPPNPKSARWRWLPGFNAGVVEVEIRIPGQGTQRLQVETDPDLRKLTRERFDAMVREILEDTFALFSTGGFRKSIARSVGTRPPSIARLEFLRSRIGELERVIDDISAKPRQRLSSEEVSVPYFRSRQATGQEIVRSFRNARVLQETRFPSRLPAPLRGFLPASIRTTTKRASFDIPEHRQIGSCLRGWSEWLSCAADQLARQRDGDREIQQSIEGWVSRCRGLARRVDVLARRPIFDSSSGSNTALHLSAIFRNDPAYRAFFGLWQDMNRGMAAVFGEFLDMPLARTWELYELWCFLRITRASLTFFGGLGIDTTQLFRHNSRDGVTVSASWVDVRVGCGWTISFQKQYGTYWSSPDRRGTFSRSMTPDIVMWNSPTDGKAAQLIVLDAKYRVEEAINDTLSSIHTYRDALVEEDATTGRTVPIVTAAFVLTPFTPVSLPPTTYRNSPMPDRLFRSDYRSKFRLGAVTLQPGLSALELLQALRTILRDAGVTRT